MKTFLKWVIRIIFWAAMIAVVVIFPKTVGAIVAGLLIAFLLIYYFIIWKIKKWLAPLKDLDLFPMQIKITQSSRTKWHHTDKIKAIEGSLTSLGYEKIGEFTAGKMPGLNLDGFIAKDGTSYALAYDIQYMNPYVDFFSMFTDGTSCTFTNTVQPPIFERSPMNPMSRFPELGIPELHGKFIRERPSNEIRKFSKEEFIPILEKNYADERDWQMKCAQDQERLSRELRENFLMRSGWTAIEWEKKQNRVTFIHDRLKGYEVVDIYRSCLDDDCLEEKRTEEENNAKELFKLKPPSLAFDEIINNLPEKTRPVKILELSIPITATAYLLPERNVEQD